MCTSLCLNVGLCTWVQCQKKPEEGGWSLRAGFKGILCWKLNVDPPAEAGAVLPTDHLYSRSPPRLGLTV